MIDYDTLILEKWIQPQVDVGGTGEIDGVCYQERARSMAIFAGQLCNGPYVFHDMTMSFEELEAAIKGKGTPEIIGSGVLVDPKLGLKTQLHLPLSTGNVPSWYNTDLATALKGYVPDGISTFTPEDLKTGVELLLEKHAKVRIKVGNGSSGEGQASVTHASNLQEVLAHLGQIDWDSGVVLEEDLGPVIPKSLTVLSTPKGIFTSMGTIVERPVNGEMHYMGTSTIVVAGMPENLLALPFSALNINDPKYGSIQLEINPQIIQLGQAVASAYMETLVKTGQAILPRLNFDLPITQDGRVVYIDPSLRVGGSSGNEFIGALNCLDGMPYSVTSSRTLIGPKNLGDCYRDMPNGKVVTLFDAPSPDIYPNEENVAFFVIDHN